jgi:pterin-4a-carbinolamine dehydratase
MENSDYLGIAGKVGHDPEIVRKYNALLQKLGTEGMLLQFERWSCDEDIESLIKDIESNLFENKILLPYKN